MKTTSAPNDTDLPIVELIDGRRPLRPKSPPERFGTWTVRIIGSRSFGKGTGAGHPAPFLTTACSR